MKVKALRIGYYNHKRRLEGSVFELKNEKHFSENWMKKVEEKVEVKESEKPNEKREPVAVSKASLSDKKKSVSEAGKPTGEQEVI